MTLGIGPGDIVVVPSFTFPTTASAFARTGARIRFVDIDPITLGMDPASLAASLDDAVTAVVPVHYGGVACDIDGVLQAARNVGAAVIEDNANGIFSTLREQPLGTFGRMSALSFHQTKSLTCGQGGALVLNDPDDVERRDTGGQGHEQARLSSRSLQRIHLATDRIGLCPRRSSSRPSACPVATSTPHP